MRRGAERETDRQTDRQRQRGAGQRGTEGEFEWRFYALSVPKPSSGREQSCNLFSPVMMIT